MNALLYWQKEVINCFNYKYERLNLNELDALFHQFKEMIIDEKKEDCLFDPNLQTCLATDCSVDGVGFFLMQSASAHTGPLFGTLMVRNCVWSVAGSLTQLRVGSKEISWNCTKLAAICAGVYISNLG